MDWIGSADRKKGLYHLVVVRRCTHTWSDDGQEPALERFGSSAVLRGPHNGVLRLVHPSPGDMMMAGRGACMPYVHDAPHSCVVAAGVSYIRVPGRMRTRSRRSLSWPPAVVPSYKNKLKLEKAHTHNRAHMYCHELFPSLFYCNSHFSKSQTYSILIRYIQKILIFMLHNYYH